MKEMIEYVKGDLFAGVEAAYKKDRERRLRKSERRDLFVIPHNCNDQGAWGAGFVMALSAWNRKPQKEYEKWYSTKVADTPHGTNFRLGNSSLVEIRSGLYVANMIGQRGFGRDRFDLQKLQAAMEIVRCHVEEFKKDYEICQFHCPKFGAGLSGGDWAEIEDAISCTWVKPWTKVVVYERE